MENSLQNFQRPYSIHPQNVIGNTLFAEFSGSPYNSQAPIQFSNPGFNGQFQLFSAAPMPFVQAPSATQDYSTSDQTTNKKSYFGGNFTRERGISTSAILTCSENTNVNSNSTDFLTQLPKEINFVPPPDVSSYQSATSAINIRSGRIAPGSRSTFENPPTITDGSLQSSLLNKQKMKRLLKIMEVSSFAEFYVSQEEKESLLRFVLALSTQDSLLGGSFLDIWHFLKIADPESKSICFQFLKLFLASGRHNFEHLLDFANKFSAKLVPRTQHEDDSQRAYVDRLVWGRPCIEIQQESAARYFQASLIYSSS